MRLGKAIVTRITVIVAYHSTTYALECQLSSPADKLAMTTTQQTNTSFDLHTIASVAAVLVAAGISLVTLVSALFTSIGLEAHNVAGLLAAAVSGVALIIGILPLLPSSSGPSFSSYVAIGVSVLASAAYFLIVTFAGIA